MVATCCRSSRWPGGQCYTSTRIGRRRKSAKRLELLQKRRLEPAAASKRPVHTEDQKFFRCGDFSVALHLVNEMQSLVVERNQLGDDRYRIPFRQLPQIAKMCLNRIEGLAGGAAPMSVGADVVVEGIACLPEEKHVPALGHVPVVVEHLRPDYLPVKAQSAHPNLSPERPRHPARRQAPRPAVP